MGAYLSLCRKRPSSSTGHAVASFNGLCPGEVGGEDHIQRPDATPPNGIDVVGDRWHKAFAQAKEALRFAQTLYVFLEKKTRGANFKDPDMFVILHGRPGQADTDDLGRMPLMGNDLTPDPVRQFLGILFVCYDRLWLQATKELTVFSDLGRSEFCQYLKRQHLDPRHYLALSNFEHIKMWMHPTSNAFVRISHEHPEKFDHLEMFVQLFWAWLGAALLVRAAESRTTNNLSNDLLFAQICRQLDPRESAFPKLMCGTPVFLKGFVVFGMVSCTHPRGFMTKEKICEFCRAPLLNGPTRISKRKTCSKCNFAHYCSKDHQVADWPFHKVFCSDKLRSQLVKDGMIKFGKAGSAEDLGIVITRKEGGEEREPEEEPQRQPLKLKGHAKRVDELLKHRGLNRFRKSESWDTPMF